MTIYARAEREGYPGSARGRVIDLINREFILKYKAEILLAGILVLSAFLNLWNIWNQGFTNTFYAAAVKSTLVNPAAGFFNSFDPAGFVTVDKPPVGLWVQAVFAAVPGVFRLGPRPPAGPCRDRLGRPHLFHCRASLRKTGRSCCSPCSCRNPHSRRGFPERHHGHPDSSLSFFWRSGLPSGPHGSGPSRGSSSRSFSSGSASISR